MLINLVLIFIKLSFNWIDENGSNDLIEFIESS